MLNVGGIGTYSVSILSLRPYTYLYLMSVSVSKHIDMSVKVGGAGLRMASMVRAMFSKCREELNVAFSKLPRNVS